MIISAKKDQVFERMLLDLRPRNYMSHVEGSCGSASRDGTTVPSLLADGAVKIDWNRWASFRHDQILAFGTANSRVNHFVFGESLAS